MNEMLALPREWLAATGEIGRFCAQHHPRRLGPARLPLLRRGAAPVGDPDRRLDARDLGAGVHHRAWHVRDRGRLLHAGPGRARRTRACSRHGATCARRCRYAFGYMMAAKVGTGIVAELGAMRISEEIDALEVMGDRLDDVPVRDAPACRLDRAAVHVHRRRRRRLPGLLHRGGASGRLRSPRVGTCWSSGSSRIRWTSCTA